MRRVQPVLLVAIAAFAVLAVVAILAQSGVMKFGNGAVEAVPAPPLEATAPAGATLPADQMVGRPPQDTALKAGVNACTNPFTQQLVATTDGICDTDLKIYQCYCPQGGNCDFDRGRGHERGTCTTPGVVHPVVAH